MRRGSQGLEFCFWHLASFAATHHFVRFWTTADKVGFWRGMFCLL